MLKMSLNFLKIKNHRKRWFLKLMQFFFVSVFFTDFDLMQTSSPINIVG